MSIKVKAAVMVQPREQLRIEELELEAPHADEVMVEIAATGVCHSDLSVYQGVLPTPLPVVLGHESAGTVVALGSHVTDLAIGDKVVLSLLAQCGKCFYCSHSQPVLCESGQASMLRSTLSDGTTRFRWNNAPVYHMTGLGTFAQRVVVPAASAMRLPESLPLTQAALLGCGVITGFGAAVNTAKVEVGECVAVLGCGGVGLNAIQGARISGASKIIAIDPREDRLALAQSLGATDVLTPGKGLIEKIRAMTEGRGVDVALEVAGRQQTIDDAIRMTRRGGRVVIVSAPGKDVVVNIPALGGLVMTEKSIRGSLYGSAHVRRDVARLLALYASGQLVLDKLVSATFDLDHINEAIEYCGAEQGARAIVIP
ncbi:MAG: Zn-dependent alcohol dehydrogenase [Burkholderiaceae bacterium]|nr:Zn-dependent alcohol dehydrogenase [Burkholderiaceae bacterium]